MEPFTTSDDIDFALLYPIHGREALGLQVRPVGQADLVLLQRHHNIVILQDAAGRPHHLLDHVHLVHHVRVQVLVIGARSDRGGRGNVTCKTSYWLV